MNREVDAENSKAILRSQPDKRGARVRRAQAVLGPLVSTLPPQEPHAPRPEEGDSAGCTTEQQVAAGKADWTPVALLASVVGVIAVLFVAVLALVVAAYLLA